MKQERKATLGRREFLRTLGAGATVAAAAAPAPLADERARRHRDQRREAQGALPGELEHVQDLLSRQPVSELRRQPVLIKRTERQARRGTLAAALQGQADGGLDRRGFLRRSGLVAGGLAALGALPLGSVRKAQAGPPPPAGAQVTIRKNICTHCSVGCTVIAEVANGVWIGQEPGWDSPINRGSHCAKGASVRELVHGDRRLKYPMKLVNGQWTRVTWEQAIDEIGDKLHRDPREVGAGLGLLARLGQVLQRRLLSLPQVRGVLGHQQRRPPGAHLPFDDRRRRGQYLGLRRDDQQLQRHPQLQDAWSSWAAIRRKRIRCRCSICSKARSSTARTSSSIDPRLTRTAAHATEYVRMRPGTDIPMIYGMLWHIFKNGWEDKEFIRQRVYGMDEVRKEVEKWTPDEVERVTGVPEAQLKRVAEMFAKEQALDADLGDGADPAHGRHRQRARQLHPAARDRQRRRLRQRRQHLPRPLQRAGRDRSRPRYRDAAALLRPRRGRLEALVPGLGGRLRLDARRASTPSSSDGDVRHSVDALVRRDPAAEGSGRAEGQSQGDGGVRARRQHRHPHAGGGQGHREARSAGGRRPASDHLGGAQRAQERHLSAADLHAVRDVGLAHGVEPLAAVGRADRQADLRIEGRLRGHVSAWRRSSASPT